MTLTLLTAATLAVASFAFGCYNLCDAFAGRLSRFSAAFPINLLGGIAGVMLGLYVGLPLILT